MTNDPSLSSEQDARRLLELVKSFESIFKYLDSLKLSTTEGAPYSTHLRSFGREVGGVWVQGGGVRVQISLHRKEDFLPLIKAVAEAWQVKESLDANAPG